ncbi:DoxX family protein [Candidatus Woesearchaeota archaeon]|nr:DoxX family protein [Candidatus Woesearchaeota archaeon]
MMRLYKLGEYSSIPLRLVLAALFLFAGINKALALQGTAEMFKTLAIPAPLVFAFLVMLLEIIGGICFLLGLFTRYAAIWLSIIMIFAIILVHAKQVMVPETRMLFFMAIITLAGLFTLIMAGAKRPSLDEHFLLD